MLPSQCPVILLAVGRCRGEPFAAVVRLLLGREEDGRPNTENREGAAWYRLPDPVELAYSYWRGQLNPENQGGGMKVGRWEKESFVVIGKEGTTADGDGFIQRLWADANAHFDEIRLLDKTDATGI